MLWAAIGAYLGSKKSRGWAAGGAVLGLLAGGLINRMVGPESIAPIAGLGAGFEAIPLTETTNKWVTGAERYTRGGTQ